MQKIVSYYLCDQRAKVLAYNLSELGYRAIDIGHIDSEYEWFKMGGQKKSDLSKTYR